MISIIFPFKNTSEFLKDCLESIIQQSEKDWELIAVNDHSTDNSKEILLEYSRADERIRLYDNSGVGIIEALKTGYDVSHGEYIHRMDSDDIMPKGKLSNLKTLLEESGKGHVATGKVKYFNRGKISIGYKYYENWINNLILGNRHWNEIYKECVIASPAWMIHRDDFERCGAFNSEYYPEDYDLVFRFYKNQLKVRSTDALVHLWREHPQRTSRNSQNYQQQAFFHLKTEYWLKLEKQDERFLALIGVGIKNKLLKRFFKNKQIKIISFNDPDNLSKSHFTNWLKELFESELQAQFIITIAEEDVKNEIRMLMKQFNLSENKDFYFFS